jgi:predicted small secreted protein
MWASVQTIRGCAKHCSFCSVWRTDGQRPRQRPSDPILEEIVELRRRGFRFVARADDNFYPVSLTDMRLAERQNNAAKVAALKAIRGERFELMERLAELPKGMVFFTQITMEAAEDPEFLEAMRKARIMGALVGVEAVTAEGLKAVFKDFNLSGENLVQHLREFQQHGIHVLGSFIFGLPTDSADTFQATQELVQRSGIAFAQFVMLTPFCGTVDFERWEKSLGENPPQVEGIPITRYWLIPPDKRPKMFMPHPTMSSEDMRARTQGVWDNFYSLPAIWKRSACTPTLRARLAFVFISKLYRQMYASTGIATDSARRQRANLWARRIAKVTRRLFQAEPMPACKCHAGYRTVELPIHYKCCGKKTVWSHGERMRFRVPSGRRSSVQNFECCCSVGSTWSCERILSPRRRHIISAPGIRVSNPSCSTTHCAPGTARALSHCLSVIVLKQTSNASLSRLCLRSMNPATLAR